MALSEKTRIKKTKPEIRTKPEQKAIYIISTDNDSINNVPRQVLNATQVDISPETPKRSHDAKHTNQNEKPSKNDGPKEWKKYVGLLLTLLASFLFSVVVLLVKVLRNYGVDAYSASLWRNVGTVLPTIPLLIFYEWGPGTTKQSSVFTSVWPITTNWKTWIGLLSRGLIASTAVVLRYYALEYLSIGDTSVIAYSTPVLVTILGHFFLGEKCGVVPVIVAFTTLCGVVIVTRPPVLTGATEFDENTLIGTGLASGSLVCCALGVIISRKIRQVHFTVMILVFGVIGLVQSAVLIYFWGNFSLPTELVESCLVGGLAILSFFAQLAFVLALKFEQAGPVSLIRSCDVLFGFLFQYIFLNVAPDIYSAVGGVIVLVGIAITAVRKWLNTLSPDDDRRKRWRIILK